MTYYIKCKNEETKEKKHGTKFKAAKILHGYKISRNVGLENWKSSTMKNKKYQTVITVPIFNRKLVKTGKIDTTYTWPLTYLAWYKHFNKKWQGVNNVVDYNMTTILAWV